MNAGLRALDNAIDSASADGRSAVEIRHLSKWFGSFQVLKDVNLTVRNGERIVICGPSGSGKSTLIRCINHLESHQEGQVLVNGDLLP